MSHNSRATQDDYGHRSEEKHNAQPKERSFKSMIKVIAYDLEEDETSIGICNGGSLVKTASQKGEA